MGIESLIGGLAGGFAAGRKSKEDGNRQSAALEALRKLGQRSATPEDEVRDYAINNRKGGVAPRDAKYSLHRGELVVPRDLAKRLTKRTTSRPRGRR